MAAVSTAAVRQRFASRVASLSGWTLSPVPFDLLAPSAVPDAIPASIAHQCFAVRVSPTEDTHGRRSTAREGALVSSDVRVRFLFRVAPKDQVASEDGAHNAAHVLAKSLMAQDASWPFDLKLSWESQELTLPAPGEWFSGELRFSVLHLLALS